MAEANLGWISADCISPLSNHWTSIRRLGSGEKPGQEVVAGMTHMFASRAIPHFFAILSIVGTSRTKSDRHRVQYSSLNVFGRVMYRPWSISTCN